MRETGVNGSTGQVGYEAYTKASGGKNFRGEDCPKWWDLPQNIRDYWNYAGEAILSQFSGPPRNSDDTDGVA